MVEPRQPADRKLSLAESVVESGEADYHPFAVVGRIEAGTEKGPEQRGKEQITEKKKKIREGAPPSGPESPKPPATIFWSKTPIWNTTLKISCQ